MRNRLIVILILINTSLCFGQHKPVNYEFIYQHVSTCIHENYRPDTAKLLRSCRTACIFMKFKVNDKNRLTDLSFSGDTSKFVIDALNDVADALKRDNALMQTLKKTGKAIIQPFIFNYQHGCEFPHADFSKIKGEEAR